LRVEIITLPTGAADVEVLIENRSIGICGTDLQEYVKGLIFVPKNAEDNTAAPKVLSRKHGSVVRKVGMGVAHAKVGYRVSA
jgi:(R,R)-butanediol dehydrogenase / meso-butanediol dehydrogenase / diacetyl reductase